MGGTACPAAPWLRPVPLPRRGHHGALRRNDSLCKLPHNAAQAVFLLFLKRLKTTPKVRQGCKGRGSRIHGRFVSFCHGAPWQVPGSCVSAPQAGCKAAMHPLHLCFGRRSFLAQLRYPVNCLIACSSGATEGRSQHPVV